MPTADRYTLTVNAEQARVLQEACELLARCHIGQFEHAVQAVEPMAERDEYDPLCTALKRVTFPKLGFCGSYYGITSQDRPDEARVAWDLYSLVRHRLSWDRRTPEDDVDPLSRMMVQYDEPTTLSQQPRAAIDTAACPIDWQEEWPTSDGHYWACGQFGDSDEGTVVHVHYSEAYEGKGERRWLVGIRRAYPERDIFVWQPIQPPELEAARTAIIKAIERSES